MLTNSKASLSCWVCRVTGLCAYESETSCVQHLVDQHWNGMKTGLAFDKAIKMLEAFLSELSGFNRCQNLRASTFLSLSLHPTGSATRLLKAEGHPPKCSTPITETLLSEAQVWVLISSCALSQFELGRLSETLSDCSISTPVRDIYKWTGLRHWISEPEVRSHYTLITQNHFSLATNKGEQNVALLVFCF